MLEREESIRSRAVDGVEQKVWGIFLAFDLVRLEIERIADDANVPRNYRAWNYTIHPSSAR